jgi:hypothetical protein
MHGPCSICVILPDLVPSQYIAKCNMIYSTDFISPMCKNIKRYNVERLGSGITVRVRAVYS